MSVERGVCAHPTVCMACVGDLPVAHPLEKLERHRVARHWEADGRGAGEVEEEREAPHQVVDLDGPRRLRVVERRREGHVRRKEAQRQHPLLGARRAPRRDRAIDAQNVPWVARERRVG